MSISNGDGISLWSRRTIQREDFEQATSRYNLRLGLRMRKFWNDHADWSRSTFGSDETRGPLGPLKHLAKEAVEAQEHPHDRSEYADCFLLICDAARREGMTLDDLLEEAEKKLAICKTRKWQTGVPEGEAVEHVREDGE